MSLGGLMMKKVYLILTCFFLTFGIISCKKTPIEQPKEYKQGDQITQNGVIYTYYDEKTLKNEIIPFVDEEAYKPYYNYYYFDMSDINHQPEIHAFEGDIFRGYNDFIYQYWPETFYEFLINCDPYTSPQSAYFFRLKDYFTDSLISSFIVSGYTKDLPQNVVIPTEIEGIPVTQIGYKAFAGAPMKSITFLSGTDNEMRNTLIHPYAFLKCDSLEELNSNARVLSMGITGCYQLETIRYIKLFSDCSLYNLLSLGNILYADVTPYFEIGQEIKALNPVGIRKSPIYLCPKASISGHNLQTKLFKEENLYSGVIYYNNYYPFYIWPNSKIPTPIEISDRWFEDNFYYFKYNPDTMELYFPFLNNGCELNYEFIIDENSKYIKKTEDGYEVTLSYPKVIKGQTTYEMEYNDPITLKLH